MDRQQKVKFGNEVNEMCNSHDYVAIVNVSGVASASNTSFRKKVREIQAKAFVVKNTVSRIASEDTKHKCIHSGLIGQNMVIFANDPVSMSKLIVEFSQKDKNFKPVGISDGTALYDPAKIQEIATLPSLDGMRAMLLSVILSVPTKLTRSLVDIHGSIARIISKAKAGTA